MQRLRDKIIELMQVPDDKYELSWLKECLQAAIKLEFSTLPPYLCALWSIKDEDATGPVAQSIRDQIAQEEMLHMGITCNLLTAVGGTPILNSPEGVPTYPGALPGNVNPQLEVSLRGLSPAALQIFLKIEQPEFPPVISPEFNMGVAENLQSFPTIGDFYTNLLKGFKALNPTLRTDKQIALPFEKDWIIQDLPGVEAAIQTIQRQGEGSMISPEDTGLNDLAHYYRFAEIFQGQKLITVDNKLKFEGEPIPFPRVFPMAKVPPEGYIKEQVRETVREEVGKQLEAFDKAFTKMMNQLQDAWTTDPRTLDSAIGTMLGLKTPAQALMQIPILVDGKSGSYGPCFRLVSTT